MTTLTVGSSPGQYTTLSSAISAAANGDTIRVPAGVYTNQYATVTKNISIEGSGGTAYFVSTKNVPNAKGIFVVHASGNVSISNLAFIGAETTNSNGANAAGIRYESGNLTLSNDSFYHNQDGLLATPLTSGTGNITIQQSTFTQNGVSNPALSSGYGYTHNIYVNHAHSLSITGSTITRANVGHEVKSRALSTTVTNSLVADGPTGTASYSIDLPNSGATTIRGNTIQQGPKSQNPAIIANGEEGSLQPGTLSVTGNTIVNNDPAGSSRAVVNKAATTAQVSSNLIAGLTAQQIGSNTTGTASNNTLTASQPDVAMRIASGGNQLASASATASTLTLQPSANGYSSLSATAYPGLSVDISATGTATTALPLSFTVTQSDLTATSPLASFFDNNAGLSGATVTWKVYADAANTAYAQSSLLGTRTFNDQGQMISASSTFNLPFTPTSAYSLTELVTIRPPAAVPGPSSLALVATGAVIIATLLMRRRHCP